MSGGIERREFLRGAFAAVGVGAAAPSLFARALQDSRAAAGASGRILVVVQLSGGNDGLNTVVPYADDLYYKARPTLAIDAKEVARLDDRVGLHPSLAPLKARFDAGEVAIVQGVGYPDPSRSHFRSMEIWHTGEPGDAVPRAGWLGRFADAADPDGANPSLLVHAGSSVPFALARERAASLAFDGLDAFSLAWDRKHPKGRDGQEKAFRRVCECEGATGRSPYVGVVRRTAASALASADEVKATFGKVGSRAEYPGGVGNRLALVARMISGGMKSRVYYLSMGGYDTHANQRPSHANLLGQFAGSADAFFRDLAGAGRAKDVALLAFSEFGRRVAENGSAGTDHGAAGPVFLVGPGVKAGVHGAPPDLADLDGGDPKFTTDFRSVYRAALEAWLGADRCGVPDSIPAADLFAARA